MAHPTLGALLNIISPIS